MAKDYFSKSDKNVRPVEGEIVPQTSASGMFKEINNVNSNDLPFLKRWQFLRDTAQAKADHYKEMALTLFEYQQKDYRNQMDALLQSRGKQIITDTAIRDADINKRLAELDEEQKDYFEEYIYNFKTKRMLKYNERMTSIEKLTADGKITLDQEKEIKDQMAELKAGIDASFVEKYRLKK
jgi:hypothetical protein